MPKLAAEAALGLGQTLFSGLWRFSLSPSLTRTCRKPCCTDVGREAGAGTCRQSCRKQPASATSVPAGRPASAVLRGACSPGRRPARGPAFLPAFRVPEVPGPVGLGSGWGSEFKVCPEAPGLHHHPQRAAGCQSFPFHFLGLSLPANLDSNEDLGKLRRKNKSLERHS